MKYAFLAAACAALVTPAAAQQAEGRPLLRVYVDTPYFYDIIATGIDASDPQAQRVELTVEGKEVGGSTITYSCVNGDYGETVTTPWTGGADAFIPAALMAYSRLYC